MELLKNILIYSFLLCICPLVFLTYLYFSARLGWNKFLVIDKVASLGVNDFTVGSCQIGQVGYGKGIKVLFDDSRVILKPTVFFRPFHCSGYFKLSSIQKVELQRSILGRESIGIEALQNETICVLTLPLNDSVSCFLQKWKKQGGKVVEP